MESDNELEIKFLEAVRNTFINNEGKDIYIPIMNNTVNYIYNGMYSKEFLKWCQDTYPNSYRFIGEFPYIELYYRNKRLYAKYKDKNNMDGNKDIEYDVSHLPEFMKYIWNSKDLDTVMEIDRKNY